MNRDVYLLSGEFALPQGQLEPVQVFRTEREERARGGTPSLEHLLTSAAERTLERTGLPSARLRPRITHLLATTMPEVKLEEMNLGLLSTRLKSALELAPSCQARFEVGSSDAGASAFATAWEATRQAAEPRTTLVLAGQVMPGGSEAIRAISKVLEPAERRIGLTMLAVGDLYMDLFARGWRLDALARSHALLPLPPDTDPRTLLRALIDRLTREKLELAREYPPANRSGEIDFGAWSTPWFRVGHVAPATSGAAAILMTNDPELVLEWAQTRGPGGRLVRVLGVAEGEQETAITRRPHPLSFVKSIRQALSSLGRVAGVNLNGLRASAFALLHDAFLSIEMAFLMGLGMLPLEAVQKQLTFWPNPYGGLTAFGHAIGASGLVQVVKTFQIFTHPAEMFAGEEPAADSCHHHPRFDRIEGRTQALTTSVGGPLSHVVAALLEAVPLQQDGGESPARLPLPFAPAHRHRFDPVLDGDLPAKADWVASVFARYLEAYSRWDGVGLLEARTAIDLRSLARPLPDQFLEDWQPPALDTPEGPVSLSAETLAALRRMLGSAPVLEEKGPDFGALFQEEARRILLLRSEGDGPPDPKSLEPRVKALRDNLLAGTRPWMGLVAAPSSRQDDTIRTLALLAPGTEEAEPGTMVRFIGTSPYPLVVDGVSELPGLVPLWEQQPVRVQPPLAEVRLDPALVAPVVQALLASEPTRALWQQVRDLAGEIVRQCIEQPRHFPPVAAIRLLRALVLMPDPMPERVAECLEQLCSADPECLASTHAHRAARSPVAYCLFDLVGALHRSASQLAYELAVVARVIRRCEGWLCLPEANLEHSGDRFYVTGALSPTQPELDAWIALARFGRDVYQEALARGIRLRAGISVGHGLRFTGVDARFNAAGPVVNAVQGVLRHAPEARRGLLGRQRDDRNPDLSHSATGEGVFLSAPVEQLEDADFDRIWNAAGGEPLEVIGRGILEPRPGTRETYRYQYRARRSPLPPDWPR